ncbi:MAG: nitrilase-related carbon-nitrogen hydrolase [Candidatus Thorarchaeota archaeon]
MVDFSVALVQMPCNEGNREDNFSYAKEMLENHKTESSREFILFPELFSIGFRYSDYSKLGVGIPGPTTEFLQDIAEEHSAYVAATDIESTGTKYHNTLVMVNPKGRVIATYRKMHPFQDEQDVFEGGNTAVIVEAGNIKVGLQICYDVRFPELSRLLAGYGADLLLLPAAFPDPRAAHWDNLVMARAIENQVYIAATNRVGWGYDGKTYFGHSQFVDPWGVRSTRINSDIFVFRNKGDTDMIREVRKQITCWQDRVPDKYEKIEVSKE